MADGATGNFISKSSALAAEAQAWVSGNAVGILVATAIGVAIALAMLAVRSLGCKLIARLGTDPHWPAIFARALSRTKLYFIIFTSAELVAEHANTPPVLSAPSMSASSSPRRCRRRSGRAS